MQSSAGAEARGAPVEVDLGKLKPQEQISMAWRGRSAWILHRSQRMLETLRQIGVDPEFT